MFSLIKPISSNESLLLGLNSSEINPKAAKLPTTSSQCSEAAFYSYRERWVNTTTSNHAPAVDLQIDTFKANVFPAAVQSPLLKAQSAKTTSSGSNSRYHQKNILQVRLCFFFFNFKKRNLTRDYLGLKTLSWKILLQYLMQTHHQHIIS